MKRKIICCVGGYLIWRITGIADRRWRAAVRQRYNEVRTEEALTGEIDEGFDLIEFYEGGSDE